MEELVTNKGFWSVVNNAIENHTIFSVFCISIGVFTYLGVKNPELIKWILEKIFKIFKKEEEE